MTTKTPTRKQKTESTEAKPQSDIQNNAVDPDLRLQMIAEAAYYKAEKRGFSVGCDQDDWFEAEREVDQVS